MFRSSGTVSTLIALFTPQFTLLEFIRGAKSIFPLYHTTPYNKPFATLNMPIIANVLNRAIYRTIRYLINLDTPPRYLYFTAT